MKRLLAAVGLAAVVCLVLVLSACTDGVSSPDEADVILDRADTVSGTVYRGGDPQAGASVWIHYFYTQIQNDACESGDTTDQDGFYEINYIEEARGRVGKAQAWIWIGPIKWEGWSDLFFYPPGGGEVTDIDIELKAK